MNINQHTSGIIFKILNLFTYSLLSIIVKISLAHTHTFQILFFLNIAGLTITSTILALKEKTILPTSKVNKFYISRSIVYTLGIVSWASALTLIPITEATAISYLTPLIAAFFGVIILKEEINRSIILSLILGLIGMLIILKPFNNNILLTGISFAIASALMWSVHDVIVKFQTKSDGWLQQTHIVFFLVSIISAPMAIYVWKPIDIKYVILCLLVGALSVINKFFLVTALSKTQLVTLAPISFLRLIFTAVLAYLFFGEIVDSYSLFGAVVIVYSTRLMIKKSSKMLIKS